MTFLLDNMSIICHNNFYGNITWLSSPYPKIHWLAKLNIFEILAYCVVETAAQPESFEEKLTPKGNGRVLWIGVVPLGRQLHHDHPLEEEEN